MIFNFKNTQEFSRSIHIEFTFTGAQDLKMAFVTETRFVLFYFVLPESHLYTTQNM